MNDKFEKGDAVLIDYSLYGKLRYKQGTIIEVTKAGNYKVLEDGKEKYDLFNSNGKMRGDNVWNSTYIIKFSQEKWEEYLEQQEKSRIIIKIKNTSFSNFNINSLLEIEKIIDKHESEKS